MLCLKYAQAGVQCLIAGLKPAVYFGGDVRGGERAGGHVVAIGRGTPFVGVPLTGRRRTVRRLRQPSHFRLRPRKQMTSVAAFTLSEVIACAQKETSRAQPR